MDKPQSTAPGSTQAVDAISAFLEGQSTYQAAPSSREAAAATPDMVGAREILRAVADGPRKVSELQATLGLDFAQFAKATLALTNAGLIELTKHDSEEVVALTSQGTALMPLLQG